MNTIYVHIQTIHDKTMGKVEATRWRKTKSVFQKFLKHFLDLFKSTFH